MATVTRVNGSGLSTAGNVFCNGHVFAFKFVHYVFNQGFGAINESGFTPTPQSSSSKFHIQCTIGICSGSATTAFRIYRGGSVVAGLNGTGASTRIGVAFRMAGSTSHTDANHSAGSSFSVVDSPGSASASVYSIRYFNQSSATSYIGSSPSDGDTAASYGSRTSSSLTVMEIAG